MPYGQRVARVAESVVGAEPSSVLFTASYLPDRLAVIIGVDQRPTFSHLNGLDPRNPPSSQCRGSIEQHPPDIPEQPHLFNVKRGTIRSYRLLYVKAAKSQCTRACTEKVPNTGTAKDSLLLPTFCASFWSFGFMIAVTLKPKP